MFNEFLETEKLPAFRLRQLWKFYYQQYPNSFEELSTWPADLRKRLVDQVPFTALQLKQEFKSKSSGTIKALFVRPNDGKLIEAVLMQHQDGRNTVCVSSMIGCPVGCVFCATGRMGFIANLTQDEIIEQVLYFGRLLKPKGKKITNVVFMGMGEPLLNLPQVIPAVDILTNPEKMGLSDRRVAISTSGYIKQLKDLVDSGFKGRLAISLHAPNQALRAKLMPVANTHPLADLMYALDEYVARTNKRVFYEYLLLDNVNDSVEHANELADLLYGRLAHVNLIPFNSIGDPELKKSRRETVTRFQEQLISRGISATIRITMGSDIEGACGQLATKVTIEK